MSRYAADTSVSTTRSIGEIQETLDRYGASQFAFIKNTDGAMIAFEYRGRRVRFSVPLPRIEDFKTTEGGRSRRSPDAIRAAYEQSQRQRFRALLLVIKSKLESIESGIETFDQAFMAQMLMPGNQTVSDWLVPRLSEIYETGQLPPLLALESGNTYTEVESK